MKKVLVVITVLLTQLTHAQKEEVKNYEWEVAPKFREVPEEFKKYPAVVLKDYRLYDNRVGQYAYKAFVVMHSAIKILTEDGVNDYNKVKINKQYVRDYRDLKARVIKANGKIEVLSEDKIIEKEKSDERQFVFEGVEKGDIIEYYYVIKDFPDFSGVEYFQRDIPVLEAKFQINANVSSAVTSVYGYNGMKDESVKRHRVFTATNLPAYKEEVNAANLANMAKVYYYTDINRNYSYITYYKELTEFAEGVNAKSMVKNFIRDQKLDDETIALDERLKRMDIYLKENVEIVNQNEFYNYKKIFDENKITGRMCLYLYKDILDYLRIPYQFLASTDKFDNHLDKENVVPATLSEIMIYIPETQKYLSPFYYWMPYGPPNSVSVNNDAIFFEQKRGSAKIDYHFEKTQGISMNDNVVKTTSLVKLDDDMETVTVKKKLELTGYRAYYYRSVLKYIKEDKIKEMVNDAVFSKVDIDLKSHSFSNKEYKYNYGSDHPFTIDTDVVIKESWVENAGKNYLVSLGKVLGEQTNLYQETDRRQDIDLYYPKKYIHSIVFEIPPGYTVKNAEQLKMHKELKDAQNKVVGSFDSTAKVEGNQLKINIEEFYDFTHLGKEKYPQYRDLIDTAYDFFKASVVLTK
ncbi:MAG: DUF3857 domain-containing protein [Bacteroidetes bacterium]|nr:DUF3857 domain-containing protein [Bacteroidota bacterium]